MTSTAAKQADQEALSRRFVRQLRSGIGPLFAALILICVVLSIASPEFLTTSTLTNIMVQVSVVGIAADVGWSVRHLEHRFRSEFGVTPKGVARITRFERSVAAARDPRRRLADIAVACGYADQAHLARDWRDLAGRPPSRWRVEDEFAFVQDEALPLLKASGS